MRTHVQVHAIPQVDGRVGMAALLVEEGAPPPCMATLFAETAAQLPSYAQPRFVRLLSSAAEIATTITFKPRTAALQAEGCDPAKVRRPQVTAVQMRQLCGNAMHCGVLTKVLEKLLVE